MTRKKAVPIGIAVLIYLITCGMMLWFQFGIYHGALETSSLGILLAVPLVLAVAAFATPEDELRVNRPVKARIDNACLWLLCVMLSFKVAYRLNRTRYDLEAWMLAVVLIVAAIVAVVPALEWLHHNQFLLFALLYAALFVTALVVLAVIRPVTVRGAERLVEQAGYETAAYRTTWPRSDIRLITSRGILEPESLDENSWGYYWLSAQKGGEEYAVAVSVAEGRICAAEKQDGEGLKYW